MPGRAEKAAKKADGPAMKAGGLRFRIFGSGFGVLVFRVRREGKGAASFSPKPDIRNALPFMNPRVNMVFRFLICAMRCLRFAGLHNELSGVGSAFFRILGPIFV